MTLTTRIGMWRRALIVAAISTAIACNGSPTNPSGLSGPFAGTWQGTMTDAGAGTGTVTMTMTIRPAQGTAAVFGVPYQTTGTWHGEFSAANLTFDFNAVGYLQAQDSSTGSVNARCDPEFAGPNVFGKTLTLQATVAGNRMSGTYSAFLCSGLLGGTFDFTRK